MNNKIEIMVIMNNEFTNHFLPTAIDNIIETIQYTHDPDEKYNGHVNRVNFIVAKKFRKQFFMLNTLDLKKLEETTHHGTKFNIIEVDETDFPAIFNKLKDYTQPNTDYVALYSANTTWVKNHLIESIKAIQIQKRKWSVSYVELLNDITTKEKSIMNYREPNITNHLVNDIIIGEIVVKKSALKDVEFKRGIVKEFDQEFFYPGYALKAGLKEYALCERTTVRHHMELYVREQLEYIPEKYEFDKKLISEEDKKKIIFTVIVNASNIRNQALLMDALNSLAGQQFPLENIEILFISNYNSMTLFLTQDQITKKFPNIKTIFTANHLQDDYGKMQSMVWFTGLKQAVGEYITYLDLDEGFIFSPAYLSELYMEYRSRKGENELKWIVSNYFDVINYVPRHSNIKVLNRAQLYFSNFSHKKMEIQYPTIKAIDKNFASSNLALINIINHFNNQKLNGTLSPKALIRKIK